MAKLAPNATMGKALFIPDSGGSSLFTDVSKRFEGKIN